MTYEPLVRSFSSYEACCAAREAVIAAGVSAEAVELRVIDDEAGPVEGNFLVGNGRRMHDSPPAAVKTGPEVPYDSNFRHVVRRGAYLLIISKLAGGPTQEAIDAALAPFDAAAPGPV